MSSAKASVTKLAQQGSGRPIEPDFPSFARRYDGGVPQVAWTRLVADLETPVSATLKLAHERPNSFLLESVEGGATRGRYSIIGCEPDLIWRADGAKAEINRAPQSDPDAFAPAQLPALASLRALLAESAIALPPELPPMAAGIFGYMGYDTVRLIEHLPGEKPDRLGLPDSILVRPTLIVIFDSVKDEMTVVTPVRPAPGVSAKAAYARAADRLKPALANVSFHDPAPPFMSTVTARLEGAQRLAALLVEQLTGPVKFTQAARGLVEDGVDLFVEIGPGQVLSGLLRRCDRSLRTVSVGDPAALTKLEEVLSAA